MPASIRSLPAALALALLFAAAPGLASAQYAYSTIALGGETAPDTGGATYVNGFQDVGVNAAGRVAFLVELSGGIGNWGAFLHDGVTTAPVALGGDTAPDTGGGTYFLPGGFLTLNASDDVTFVAAVLGGSVSTGLFRASGGAQQSIVVPGDAAPGTGGGSFAGSLTSLNLHSATDAGTVTFTDDVTGGTTASGVFAETGGVPSAIAVAGDTAPGTGGGTFSAFGSPSEGSGGHVAFAADVAGGSAASGLFRRAGGTLDALLLAGDTAPDSGGGVYADFLFPRTNGSGGIVFLSNLTGSTPTGGIFLTDGVATQAVALEGDVAPQTGGATYAVIPSLAAINDAGDVVFPASLVGGSVTAGVFLRDGPSGQTQPVALAGSVAPDTGGATFVAFDRVALNGSDQVAFQATLSDGNRGVFLATPAAAVPALGGLGRAALVAALGAAALLAASRRMRRR